MFDSQMLETGAAGRCGFARHRQRSQSFMTPPFLSDTCLLLAGAHATKPSDGCRFSFARLVFTQCCFVDRGRRPPINGICSWTRLRGPSALWIA